MSEESKKYIIVKDRYPRISEVLNDCVKLCVPTYKNEPLSSILQKICAKVSSLGREYSLQAGDNIDVTGTGSVGDPWIVSTNFDEFSLFTEDTSTLFFSGEGTELNPLSGDVQVSSFPNNSLSIFTDGLYSPNTIQAGVVYGGIVTWLEGYTYHVSAAGYYINGFFYESPATEITLSSPDLTDNRLDTFILNTDSIATVLEGTPSATPSQAPLDPATQLQISIALVEVGTTEPTLNVECAYKNNVEWTAVSSDIVKLNPDSTATPCEGTKSIQGQVVTNGVNIVLTRGSSFTPAGTYTQLAFVIKSAATWAGYRRLRFQWQSAGVPTGAFVDLVHGLFGFNGSDFVSCQTISIPMTSFSLGALTSVDSLKITAVTSASISFFLDDICLQDTPIISSPTTPDEKVKVSSNDLVAGYLNGKLVAGTGIILTEINNGGNETFSIATIPGAGGELLTADNGLTENVPNNVQLGGLLIQNTSIDLDTFAFNIDDTAGSGYIQILPNSFTGSGTLFNIITNEGTSNSAVTVDGTQIVLQGNIPSSTQTYNVNVASGAAGLSYTDTVDTYRVTVGQAIGGEGIELFGLPNASTQNRLVGVTSATNLAGYVTIGSGLSLASGILSSSGIAGITADQGLTANISTNVQLGQTIGQAGDPATISVNREIPFSGTSYLRFKSSSNEVRFNPAGAVHTYNPLGGGYHAMVNPTTAERAYPGLAIWRNTEADTAGGTLLAHIGADINQVGGAFHHLFIDVKTTELDYFKLEFDGVASAQWDKLGNAMIGGLGTKRTRFGSYVTPTRTVDITGDYEVSGAAYFPNRTLITDITGHEVAVLDSTTGLMKKISAGNLSIISADNGLTENVPGNVQLGGTLLQNTTINATSAFNLLITGSGSSAPFQVSNTSTGNAMQVTASGAGTAVNAQSSTGTGVNSFSTSGLPMIVGTAPTSTSTVVQMIKIQRETSATAANGIGGSIDFIHEVSTGGVTNIANQIISKWTDAALASRTSQFIITGVNNTTTADLFTLSGSGLTRLNNYGVSTFTGTPATYPAFDVNGNIIEVSGIGSGPVITANNGLTKNSATNVQLGGSLLQNTTITGGAFNLIITGSDLPLQVTNTNILLAAIRGTNNSGGIGVEGSVNTGTGVSGVSQSGTGVSAQTNTGVAFVGSINQTSTNTVATMMRLSSQTSGGAAQDGLGGSIDMFIEGSTGTPHISNQLVSSWTTADVLTRTSKFVIAGVENTSMGDILTLNGNKSIQANGYGTGAITGTATFGAAFDATGNIIEVALGGGGGANTALSNLASVAINTALISDTNNTDDLGSTSIAWKDIYSYTHKLKGATSGEITLEATATAGTNTITLPAVTGTVVLREGTETISGAKTFSGLITNTGGYSSNISVATSNYRLAGSNSTFSSGSVTALTVEGSSVFTARGTMAGNSGGLPAANTNYAHFVVGQMGVTEASSGTHPLIGGLVLRAPAINDGTADTANTATLYIEGAPSGITPTDQNSSIWVTSGNVRLGKAGTAICTLSFEGNTSGAVTITPQAAAGTATLTLPTVTGTIVQYVEGTTASSATPTPTGNARENYYDVTALAENATFGAPTGTPANHNGLLIRITGDATPRTLGWNAIYRASTDFALPTTTTASTTMYVQFVYNSLSSTWDCLGLTRDF